MIYPLIASLIPVATIMEVTTTAVVEVEEEAGVAMGAVNISTKVRYCIDTFTKAESITSTSM